MLSLHEERMKGKVTMHTSRRISLSIVIFVVALLIPCPSLASQPTFGGIQLLDGYTAEREWAVDATAWSIKGKNNFTIDFESGGGAWADPKDLEKYAWYRERMIRGYRVRLALVRSGLNTQWEPDDDTRGLPPGNILLVSFILWNKTKLYPENSANFKAKISDPAELGDALLMILSFDPPKGHF